MYCDGLEVDGSQGWGNDSEEGGIQKGCRDSRDLERGSLAVSGR